MNKSYIHIAAALLCLTPGLVVAAGSVKVTYNAPGKATAILTYKNIKGRSVRKTNHLGNYPKDASLTYSYPDGATDVWVEIDVPTILATPGCSAPFNSGKHTFSAKGGWFLHRWYQDGKEVCK